MNNSSTINSQFHCSLFNDIPYFSCDGEMIYNIFWRQWSDLIEDICSKEVSDAMEKQNYSSIFSHLIKTDIPTIILTNYINYPPRYLIYTIVARIISSTPALRNEFCDSLVDNFRDIVDHSKSKRLFKILFCLFSVPLEKEDWGNLFVFFYNNFSILALESAKGPSVKTVFKFVSKIVSKCPQALPYSKRNPMSFRFYKFITNILYLIGENLLKDLPSLSDVPNFNNNQQSNLNLSDAISLVEAHDMKRRHTDNVTVSFASIGGNWHFARKILTTLNALFFSPFTNFGIINFYNDKSHVEVFNMIMNSMKLQDGSPLTPLLTIPKLVEEILTFFRANFGDCPEIVLEEPFLTLAFHFTQLGLISNNIESIGQSFNVLIEMLNHIPNVISLQKHVILSFGVLLNISNSLGCDFLARYNEKDPEFIPNLIESISSNIPDHLNEPFKQTYYKYMNESGSDKFSLNLMNFFDDVSNMKIQLSTIDGFSEFFQ
ncbi:hypothetical protein TVAG_215390 [Trichomonas vaginalis G3]|uniref:Uncharacterized protein n=1 Tax=Trichomonas vaginalis (strain ATCC PRA-98 / G3) TaxID=412133 RepID=A2G3Y0_TRIV3|nr:hypothetical protein TVAGG3_0283260 [Trichomonas vaginalis G3]EAX88138.1 hypothetical protein TVAG_215390 [Trichomonas vaginalis G3]KAI5526718.1 hypothetical protein TVAGG3_0283260 [Trichomonas vaginalis G3]|eukprot:XP_001301068.1 hypothetical protein [Trichomonas vaginalis G3]